MSIAVTAAKRGQRRVNVQALSRLSLEEEILSLRAVSPEALTSLPEIFAESVADSVTRVLGESQGAALLGRMRDGTLGDPDEVYASLGRLFHDGSDRMKRAIISTFSSRVHRLYAQSMDAASDGA